MQHHCFTLKPEPLSDLFPDILPTLVSNRAQIQRQDADPFFRRAIRAPCNQCTGEQRMNYLVDRTQSASITAEMGSSRRGDIHFRCTNVYRTRIHRVLLLPKLSDSQVEKRREFLCTRDG
jgi:hypothetical protein